MATFRDSGEVQKGVVIDAFQRHSESAPMPAPTLAASRSAASTFARSFDVAGSSTSAHPDGGAEVLDRRIGDVLSEIANLSPDQVENIVAYQREHGTRFGESAVALGLVSKEDVLYALSQQFHYPYATEETRVQTPELVTLNEPFSARAEYFRALRTQLTMRAFVDGEIRRAIAVISPDTGDGKTYCVSNLAVSLAQLGGRTLLVDADMRGPRVHKVFGIPNKVGLSSILSGRSDRQIIQQIPGVNSLFVLPVGTSPPNPLELVERPAFGLLMKELASKFDHVLVDTPAAIYGSDSTVIAARCGMAMLVARKNRARIQSLQAMVNTFSESSVKMVGVVMNDF
jgi:protein-tyrosine kinase